MLLEPLLSSLGARSVATWRAVEVCVVMVLDVDVIYLMQMVVSSNLRQ